MKPGDECCRRATEKIYLVGDSFEICGKCFNDHIDEQYKNEFYTTTTIQHVLSHYQTKYQKGCAYCKRQIWIQKPRRECVTCFYAKNKFYV